ncbi:hypothetical protein [Rummeliibacillus suwonensis]|uniref:hypothetical protein n=1 Tax=Rummeliibacillus suwonensis TaxID=1306154 RepID=UPI002898DF2B|nr:hypothetical protein [Rummeliibacillus suwonensis]
MYTQIKNEEVLNIAERMEALVAELRVAVVATPETVETDIMGKLAVVGAEEIINTEVEKLTANQKRAALIEKANKFVEEASNRNYSKLDGYKGIWLINGSNGYLVNHKIEFIVSNKIQSVVALIKDTVVGNVVYKGIAKCAPGDVFNAEIGKAIALARALEIDVSSEFFNAVQPDEIVVGMRVSTPNKTLATVKELIEKRDNLLSFKNYHGQVFYTKEYQGWVAQSQVTIVDDTNAQYEVI